MANIAQLRPDDPYYKYFAGASQPPLPNQGSGPTVPPDPYEDYFKQRSAMAAAGSALQSGEHSPDQYAQALKMSQEHGVPTHVALNNSDQLQAMSQKAELDRVLKESPALSQWLQQPDNMGVARDDLHNLSQVEDATKSLGASLIASPAALSRGLLQSGTSLISTVGMVSAGLPAAFDKAATILTGKQHDEAADWYFRTQVQPWIDRGAMLNVDTNAGVPEKIAHGVGGALGTLAQIVLTGGGSEAPAAAELAPAMRNMVTQVTKAMAVPSVVHSIEVGRTVYAQTNDPAAALRAASAAYVSTTASGALPISMPGGIVKRMLSAAAVGPSSAAVSNVIENAGLPSSQKQQLTPEDLLVASFTSAVLGIAGPGNPAEHFNKLDQAVDVAKLRMRSQEKFEELARNMVGDRSVSMPVEEFQTFFQARGEDPAQAWERLAGDQTGYQEAANTGADLQIPYAKYLARMSPEERAGLTPHLRATPDALTAAQSAKREEAIQGLLKDQPDEADPAREVFDQAVSDLMATGRFTRKTAEANATIVSNYYATRGTKLGKAPMDLYRADLQGEGKGIVAGKPGGQLSQPAVEGEHPGIDVNGKRPVTPTEPRTVETSVGPRTVNADYDVPLLGSSGKDGTIYVQRGWDPVIHGGILDGLDRTEFLVEHEAVEEAKEKEGVDYSKAHYDHAEPAEHAALLKKLGLKAGTPEADNAIEAYEASYKQDLIKAAQVKDPQVPPNLNEKPEEHPHNQEQRRLLAEVNKGEGKPLNQPGARGSISFLTTGGARITLGKDADFSTFLHEFAGHLFLDNLIKDGAAKDADPQVAKDLDTVLEHIGMKARVANGEAAIRKELTTDHHELFATSAEAYFREGKSPSLALKSAFGTFRKWLTALYRNIDQLVRQGYTTPLSNEVRGVMDRLLATDEAIDAAAAGDKPVLPLDEMRKLGVSEAKLRGYAAALENAKNELETKLLADLFKKKEAAYRALLAKKEVEVEHEISADPVYQTIDALANPPKDSPEIGLNREDVKERAVEFDKTGGSLADTLKGHGIKPSKDAPPIDVVAAMLGFNDGDEMLRAIADKPPKAAYVAAESARRAENENPDAMQDGTLQERALAALHNNRRAQVLQSEIELLTQLAGNPEQLTVDAEVTPDVTISRMIDLTKEAASRILAGKAVKDVNANRYLTAERRAGAESAKLAAKGKYAEALVLKRRQALNAALFSEAQRFGTEQAKGMKYFSRFDKDSIRKNIDVDIRDQVDDLLSRFDLRQKAGPTPGEVTQKATLAQWSDSQRALGYNPLFTVDMLNPSVRMHFKDMSVTQFRDLVGSVRSLEQIGKNRREVTIEGKKQDLAQVTGELIGKMRAQPDRFTDAQLAERPRAGVDPAWRVGLDRLSSLFRSAIAEVKGQHFKANQYDQHEIMGPWHRYFFEPVIAANYRFLDLRREVATRFRTEAKDLGAEWQKTLHTVVENHDLLDHSLEVPTKRRLTRGDLLSIALHVGNESNFDKLIKGMKWEPEAVWKTLHDNMGEKDWKAVRVMGEVLGSHWPEIDAMNRRLGNTSPEKIQPRPFMTKFGEMPGWYAPIKYDPVRSKFGIKQADRSAVNPEDGLFASNYYRADTTTNGSLNARVSNYHDFIDLNWHVLERSIHDTVRDLAYREALIDAHKVLVDPATRQQFMRSYGPEAYQHLQTWLGRLVNSENTDERTSYMTSILAASRRAVVASGIALRISTMEKHGGSAAIKSLGYFTGGGQKYLLSRLAAIGTDHGKQVAEALAKFPEIRARAAQQDRDFSETFSSLLEPESWHGKAERFGHSGVAWMDFLTAVPTAHAAYDWAVTEGIPKRLGGTGKPMSESDAIKFASGVVREAHGSTIEAARSNLINNRSELIKQFTVLHGFMNNSLGQHLDMVDKLNTAGIGKPEIFARYFAAQIVPALVVGAAVEGIKDGEPWWKWAAGAIAGEYAGMVPQVREAYAQIVKGIHSSGMPPLFKAIGQLVKPAQDVVKTAQGKPVKAPIKDAANAAGLFLPGLSQLGASSQFLYDVGTDKQAPQTIGDWMRGVSSGDMTQR